jgi:hypothetical protein
MGPLLLVCAGLEQGIAPDPADIQSGRKLLASMNMDGALGPLNNPAAVATVALAADML